MQLKTKNRKQAFMPRAIMAFATILFALAPAAYFAAALSGTGCATGGDCVVWANQTIDSGTSYYFNSLVINPGVAVNVSQYSSG
ncbi:MAG TPA: hypothetical protein PLO51_04965, partial [Candidatus Micrarchaeota archaeon]|nr:hypothetical protein [Candidatus Micrarchaeota archaeon]